AETTDQLSSVVLVPVPRLNSIIVAAPKARLEEVIKDLKKLDVPTSTKLQATPIPLTKASAARVASLINNFYAQRYPGEQQAEHQVRVTHDDSSNTVFVQASPADLAEIKELVKRIDTSVSSAVNEMRIVALRYAFADELAVLIQRAISQGVLAPSATSGLGQGGGGQGGIQGGGGGQGGIGALFGGGQGGLGQQNQQNRTATTNAGAGAAAQFKSTSLRFVGTPKDGKPVQSGVLEDIYLTADTRINSLIISAPEKSLELVMSLIKELDVPPAARSEINIFQLRKADAVITANIVQQLFLGTAGQRTGAAGGRPEARGVPPASRDSARRAVAWEPREAARREPPTREGPSSSATFPSRLPAVR
ncbi:MAG: secretin N-terminal domain-containing protein, partial [Planctomycetota bacterium]